MHQTTSHLCAAPEHCSRQPLPTPVLPPLLQQAPLMPVPPLLLQPQLVTSVPPPPLHNACRTPDLPLLPQRPPSIPVGLADLPDSVGIPDEPDEALLSVPFARSLPEHAAVVHQQRRVAWQVRSLPPLLRGCTAFALSDFLDLGCIQDRPDGSLLSVPFARLLPEDTAVVHQQRRVAWQMRKPPAAAPGAGAAQRMLVQPCPP